MPSATLYIYGYILWVLLDILYFSEQKYFISFSEKFSLMYKYLLEIPAYPMLSLCMWKSLNGVWHICDLGTEVCTGVKSCREGVTPHGLVYTNIPRGDVFLIYWARVLTHFGQYNIGAAGL